MLPHLPVARDVFRQGWGTRRDAIQSHDLKYGGLDQAHFRGNLVPGADAKTSWMSDEEVAVAAKETKVRGKRLSCHARSSESVKQAMRHGFDIVYHASFADEEALDMLEAQKDRIFVAPGLSVIIRLLNEGEVVGISNQIAKNMGYEIELEAAVTSMKAMLNAASACCPVATTASPGRRTARSQGLEYFVKSPHDPMEPSFPSPAGRTDHDEGKELGEIGTAGCRPAPGGWRPRVQHRILQDARSCSPS